MKADTRSSVLSGQIGVLMMVSVLVAACGKSINPPRIVGGTISTDQTGSTRPLTFSEVAAVSDWLAQHYSGWRANVATSPPGTVYISLDAPSQPAAVRLTLWLGPKYPGWNRAVLVEMSAQKTILIQSFSDADLSSVVRLIAD